RVHLNNGTASPFDGVEGITVTTDLHATAAIALGDVDGDGDLDVAAGNFGGTNRVYLNDSVNHGFHPSGGLDVTADSTSTRAMALGDVDGDGDLDVVAG